MNCPKCKEELNMIYILRMITSNPSADKTGYFATEKEAIEMRTKWEGMVKEKDDYYGETYFELEELTTN